LLVLLVFLSIIPLFMVVGKNFLPDDDQSQFEVSIRAPEGTSLGATSLLFERIASQIRQMPGVTDTLVTVGGGQQTVVNSGSIYVKLSDIGTRPTRRRNGAGDRGDEGEDEESVHGRLHQRWRPTCRQAALSTARSV